MKAIELGAFEAGSHLPRRPPSWFRAYGKEKSTVTNLGSKGSRIRLRRINLTRQLLTGNLNVMKEGKNSVAEHPEQKRLVPSRQQQAIVNVLSTTTYLRRLGSSLFDQHGITPQQYNVLRILKGAGPEGLPTLDIAERMVEHTPGITRLLDRLEAKKLVRRERPIDDRRQVLCYVTKYGLDLLSEVETPMKNLANQALRMLDDSELDELIRLLEKVRAKK